MDENSFQNDLLILKKIFCGVTALNTNSKEEEADHFQDTSMNQDTA